MKLLLGEARLPAGNWVELGKKVFIREFLLSTGYERWRGLGDRKNKEFEE